LPALVHLSGVGWHSLVHEAFTVTRRQAQTSSVASSPVVRPTE